MRIEIDDWMGYRRTISTADPELRILDAAAAIGERDQQP